MNQSLYKFISVAVFALLLTSSLYGQVAGISYSLAPSATYTWYNNRAGLNDAFMVGGRLGISFGQYVELRGLYLQTIDQQIDFGGFEIDTDEFDNTDVDLARYGAELKLNLSRGSFLPYLLLGGGVQDVGRDGLQNAKNIYGTAGLGLTLSANDRFTFSVEGKYLAYRFDAVRNLLDQTERDLNNIGDGDFSADELGNYTLGANLAFYIGGQDPDEITDIDRAYLNAFGNGFSGLRIPIAAQLSRIEWADEVSYRDTWLGGANLGVDFGPYVGLRAYYLQGMSDDNINFDFDDLAVYGGDLRLNLGRVGTGFTPFIMLGGGRINVQDGYVGRTDTSNVSSQSFAQRGWRS